MSAADSGIIDRPAARKHLLDLRNDPEYFVQELWKDRRLDRVAPLSSIELDMVVFGLSGPVRRGLVGARGTGKTTCVTCPLISWRAYRAFYRFGTEGVLCPDRKFIVISKSATEARKTIAMIREWIDHVWFLRHLAPARDQNDRSDYFDFGPAIRGSSRQPSVTAYGNVGQLEGNRGHTIIPDDFETKSNSKSQEARDELLSIAAEFDNMAFPDAPGATEKPVDPPEVCVIGTYKNEDSTYKRLAHMRMPSGKAIYHFRTYPLAAPARDDKFLNLAPVITDGLASGRIKYTENGNYHLSPLFPARFDSEDIGRKMAHGRHEFALEHMLLSNLDDSLRYPLRLADLVIHDCPRDQAPLTVTWGRRDHVGETFVKDIPCLGLPGDRLHYPIAVDRVLAPYVATRAVIDPAGVGRDRTGLAIAGFLNGSYWLKHCRGHPGGAGEKELESLALTLRRHGATTVEIETNIDVFDTYAPLLEVQIRRHSLRPGQDPLFPGGWTCTVLKFHVSGMKEGRICDALAPVMGSHRLIVDPSVIKPQVVAEFDPISGTLTPVEDEHETLQYQLSRIQRIRKCLKEDGAADALASLLMRFQTATAGVRTDPEKQRGQREAKIIQNLMKRQRLALGHPAESPRTFKHH